MLQNPYLRDGCRSLKGCYKIHKGEAAEPLRGAIESIRDAIESLRDAIASLRAALESTREGYRIPQGII
eukprot:1734468-Pyramimonas_sp.AAC.1